MVKSAGENLFRRMTIFLFYIIGFIRIFYSDKSPLLPSSRIRIKQPYSCFHPEFFLKWLFYHPLITSRGIPFHLLLANEYF